MVGLLVVHTVVVDTDSVAATRSALEQGVDDDLVVGWVDLTSPHLVDLLDELVGGPGGHRLVGIRSSLGIDALAELPVQRGLSTLRDSRLAFHTVDPELRAALSRRWPTLRLHP